MVDPIINLQAIKDARKLLESSGYLVLHPHGDTDKAAEYLRSDGWLVSPPLLGKGKDWMTPTAFWTQAGISRKTLHKKLKDPNCPKIECERGPNGRLLRLRPTRLFFEFATRYKH